jgi:membrane protein DedA with SNARE-associated domain
MEKFLEIINNFWVLLQQGHLPEVGRWNYLLLALIVAIEGPIATLLGAAAASAGLMRVSLVVLSAAVGNLTADTLWYLLGFTGKIDTAMRLGHWLGLKRSHIERLTSAMEKHGLKILFFAKLTAGFMIPTLIAAGLARLPWKRWFPVLLVGEMIWTGTLTVIGFYTTETIKNLTQGISIIVMVFSILFMIVVIWQGRKYLMKDPEFSQAVHSNDNNHVGKK